MLHGSEALSQQDKQQLSTVTGLTQVLAFADAVGSVRGVCSAACSQVKQLRFVVRLPEQVLQLPLDSCSYCWRQMDFGKQLERVSLQANMPHTGGASLASVKQCENVNQRVADQASALLRLVHVLHLPPLLDVLHQFLLLNVKPASSGHMLSGLGGMVLTDAVLEATLGSSTLSKEAYVSSVMSQPLSLTPGSTGYSSLLKPVGPITYDAVIDTHECDAQLMQDFAGGRAGDTVHVAVAMFGASRTTDHTTESGSGIIMMATSPSINFEFAGAAAGGLHIP